VSRIALPPDHGEPVEIEQRRPLSTRERVEIWNRQGGICGNSGCDTAIPHHGSTVIDEHVSPLGMGGKNALPNRALYCKPCADEKTNGPDGDISKIAKAVRIGKKHRGEAPPSPNPLRSGNSFKRRWG
jgi:hypothetical protein